MMIAERQTACEIRFIQMMNWLNGWSGERQPVMNWSDWILRCRLVTSVYIRVSTSGFHDCCSDGSCNSLSRNQCQTYMWQWLLLEKWLPVCPCIFTCSLSEWQEEISLWKCGCPNLTTCSYTLKHTLTSALFQNTLLVCVNNSKTVLDFACNTCAVRINS